MRAFARRCLYASSSRTRKRQTFPPTHLREDAPPYPANIFSERFAAQTAPPRRRLFQRIAPRRSALCATSQGNDTARARQLKARGAIRARVRVCRVYARRWRYRYQHDKRHAAYYFQPHMRERAAKPLSARHMPRCVLGGAAARRASRKRVLRVEEHSCAKRAAAPAARKNSKFSRNAEGAAHGVDARKRKEGPETAPFCRATLPYPENQRNRRYERSSC